MLKAKNSGQKQKMFGLILSYSKKVTNSMAKGID
jgi:hypothetical protein